MVRPLICVVKPKYGVCFINNAQDLQKEILTLLYAVTGGEPQWVKRVEAG